MLGHFPEHCDFEEGKGTNPEKIATVKKCHLYCKSGPFLGSVAITGGDPSRASCKLLDVLVGPDTDKIPLPKSSSMEGHLWDHLAMQIYQEIRAGYNRTHGVHNVQIEQKYPEIFFIWKSKQD